MITAFSLALALIRPAAPLVAGAVLDVPGPAGRYDYVVCDPRVNRIMAAHSALGGLSILDLSTKTIKEIAGPKCNGVTFDRKTNRIFAAGPGKKLVAYDRTTFAPLGSVDLDGPGDAMTFDTKNGKLYVDEDDGTHVWVFDPATLTREAVIDIKGAPEWIQFDRRANKIYQNIKEPNVMQVIDPETQKVTAEYPLAELQGPHGMAIDSKAGKAFSAGKNALLIQVDLATGKVEGSAPIAKGVDQIAYDSNLKRIYCACAGFISVVEFDGATIKSLGDVACPKGSHTLAVDPQTHDVWIAYADSEKSHLMQFSVAK